ncbi:MAG TPA: discoidin domain-containing protein, partial [bacterium]|nr:discoidin domain-containing protein [bacterium]
MIKGLLKILVPVFIGVTVILGMQDIPQDSMKVIYVDSEETTGEDGRAVNVLDGDPSTIWHTEWYNSSPGYPHEIVLGLDKKYDIENFSYLPRQNSGNGRIKEFEIYITSDTSNWGTPVASGTWENKILKEIVEFSQPINGKYVKLKALSEVNDNNWASAAELNLNDSDDVDINTDLDGWASSLHLGFQDPSGEDAELLMVDI